MIRRPPRSTLTDTLFPTRRSSDLFFVDTPNARKVGNFGPRDCPAVAKMDFGIVCRKIFERGTGKEEIIFSFARDRRSCEILILQSLDRLRPVRGSRDCVTCRFDLSRCERVELTRPGVSPLPADAGPDFHVRGVLRSAPHLP